MYRVVSLLHPLKFFYLLHLKLWNFHSFSVAAAAAFAFSPPTTSLVFRHSLDISIANVSYIFYLVISFFFFYKISIAFILECVSMTGPSQSSVINLPESNRSTLYQPEPLHHTTTLHTNLCAAKGTDLRPHCCQKQAEDISAHRAVAFCGVFHRSGVTPESFLQLFTPLCPRPRGP